jgi:hypothetical protein
VERIVFDCGRITILGSLQLDGGTPRTLPFRVEGEIAKGSKTMGAGRAIWLVGFCAHTLKVSAFGANLPRDQRPTVTLCQKEK